MLEGILFTPIKDRDAFSCDLFTQRVIELAGSHFSKRVLRAGRLYGLDRYWREDGAYASKPIEFVEWAERVYKVTKRSLIKIEHGFYAGREALELRRTGMLFEGLDIGIGVIGE
jgi:hypothetical protein